MKRITWIKIHLYLSGVSLIFMALMSMSGANHLLLDNESETTKTIKTIALQTETTKSQLESIFKKELTELSPDYNYDYIKGSDKSLMTRPTTRSYYTIKVKGNEANIQMHEPSLIKSLMELHKGHGPRSSRAVLGVLGIIVIGSILSGLWLGLSSPAFRKTTILTVVSGLSIYMLLFFL